MLHKVLYSYAGIATQILIQDPHFIILLDSGDGIIRDLLEENVVFPLTVPLYIFLSHGHYDHCGGLFSLLGFLRMLGQTSPVRIYYPAGSNEIKGLVNLFKSSYSDTIPFELKMCDLQPQTEIAITKEVRVVAYEMRHMGSTRSHGMLPEIPAFGYAIFKGSEKWLAYTGDTGINENLPILLEDASHAYIEATNLSAQHSEYHLNKEEAIELGRLTKNFTLVHTRK
ncbi:MAG: ribonuclease Z [Candidatus Heimdallarchaeota archaeon]|nr:MAG: ribonuclease Z [Candidatus Heimdallarchaeota archaeon]